MDANDITRELRAAGRNCGDIYMNGKGQLCLVVDDVAMFQADAETLLRGRSTLKEIIESNKGKDLGWTYPNGPE